jgi:hypothetical protein
MLYLSARHAYFCAVIASLGIAFMALSAQSAVKDQWVRRYNGPANGDDQTHALVVDVNGNVIVTGYSNNGTNDDIYTAKYAALNGALVWEKRYDGAKGYDYAIGLAVDHSGNVFMSGYSFNGSQDVFYTAKYAAADGALLWSKFNAVPFTAAHPSALMVDAEGNAVVTGTLDNGRSIDYYTIKLAADTGELIWEKRYSFPDPENRGDDYATAVAVDGAGNVVVTGTSIVDLFTIKYAAANGALLWEKRGPIGRATDVAVDESGDVLVTGASQDGNGYDDFYTAKYAAVDGALLWEKRYNGPAGQDDVAQAVSVDRNGDVVVTGYSYNGDPLFTGNADFYTAKYAGADGVLLWEKRYNGPARRDDQATGLGVDGSGNVLVTGTSQADYYTAKYAAADGMLLWEKRYNGPANGNEFVPSRNLAVGPNGMVAISGYSDGVFSARTTSDYATVVYQEILPPVSITADGAGGYFIRGDGITGAIYQLQRATSVAGPWTSNSTITAISPGLIEFHETNAPSGQAFYRTSQP